MIELFDKVKIKKTGVVGIVLDVRTVNDETRYTVESDDKESTGGYPGKWPQYDCLEAEIEVI